MSTTRLRRAIALWWDTGSAPAPSSSGIDPVRVIPFVAIHLLCLGVFVTGCSTTAIAVAAFLYVARMFAITAFYHRYFAHRAFRASRPVQFLFALAGASAAQRGPLWWAAHHRHHHAHSDTDSDAHSPHRKGFLWSHIGWFLASENFATRTRRVADWMLFPELRFLDRFDVLVPLSLIGVLYASGEVLAHVQPSLATSGLQLVVWGFGISTVALYHATFLVNSLAHRWGTRPFDTRDDSRNNALIALVTLGEGWHNNHHRFPGSARQGLRWWELDLTYLGLRALAATGMIRDLRAVPAGLLEGRARGGSPP